MGVVPGASDDEGLTADGPDDGTPLLGAPSNEGATEAAGTDRGRLAMPTITTTTANKATMTAASDRRGIGNAVTNSPLRTGSRELGER